MIQVHNLTKRYPNGQLAIEDLSLQVKEHEIFAFLGPNGAGKTTTIRILTTLTRPTGGSAQVAEYDVIREPSKVRQHIGYVAQESGVEYCLTGRENLFLQGHLYRLDRKTLQSRVEEMLRLFDLTDVADRWVSQYSGGMRRKLDIAMALLHQPRLLFLDEPSLGLDPHSRLGLWDYVRKVNQTQGVTIFLTTHYLEEADRLAHRIGILDKGKLKIIDTAEGLKDSIGGDVVTLLIESGIQAIWNPEIQGRLRGLSSVKDLLVVDPARPAGGHECAIYVKQGREALPKILQILDAAGIAVKAATLSRPSLDDVFLKYTGHRLKEEVDPGGSGGEWQKWWKPDSSGTGDSNSNGWQASGDQPSGDGQSEWDWKKHASSS